ncbi:MAG: hypothetical protein V2A58_13190 [Planctomycetota bacterium]
MKRTSLWAALAVMIACGARGENLALGRPYTFHPGPTYTHCADEGDKTQLTDGETRYTGGMWMFPSTVGWSAGIDVPVVILFDLGEEATLSKLLFNTAGGGGAGVVEVGLRVYVSLDDKSYVLAGEHTAPPPPAEGEDVRVGVRVKVSLNGARARYVAVVAMAPAPYYFVFVDEIEVIGEVPADPNSIVPILSAIPASGARGLQEVLAGGRRASNLLGNLVAPMERQIACWPESEARAQRDELAEFRGRVVTEPGDFEKLRAELTARHRVRAREIYGADAVVWEVVPDDAFTMLSLPEAVDPPQSASVDTVVNALEATALGVANLTDKEASLTVEVSGGAEGAPDITPRVARFFETTNAMYVPDALLATDCPQVIPPGESKLVWVLAESTGAEAGTYEYRVTLTVGEDIHTIPVTVRVHNVTLSAETPLSTGNWSDLNTGEHPLFPEVRDSMLSHRITMGAASAQGLPRKDADGNVIRPIEIDFADMDKFVEFHKDFAQVSWFFPFNQHVDRPQYGWFGPVAWMSDEFKAVFREWVAKMVEHIRSKGRDYDAFYFQMFDETLDEKVAAICELVHSADPKVRMMITIPQASRAATGGLVKAGMNIYVYHAPRVEYAGTPDGFPVLRSGGRELWFYGAADAAYGGGKERDPLGFFRYLHWTAFHHGATGVHFWNMLHNRTSGWISENVEQNYWPMVYTNGPKYPAPPDDVKTAEKVIPSRRWEYVRMGIEDYMLLRMAEGRIARLGEAGEAYRQRLHDIVKAVITNRAADRRLFREKRGELVELVETLSP